MYGRRKKDGRSVDTSTGAQTIERNLLTVKGVIPVSFTLSYNSLVLNEGTLGKAWTHHLGHSAHLEELPEGDIKVRWSDNRSNTFKPSGNNQFYSPNLASRYDKLNKNADGSFTLKPKTSRNIYEFNASGQLTQLKNQNGQALNYAYDGAGRLSRITEPVSGIFLNYAYNVSLHSFS